MLDEGRRQLDALPHRVDEHRAGHVGLERLGEHELEQRARTVLVPRAAEAPTAAVEDGCYRQVEYAGILRGARNEDGARTLLEFMLSEAFQADVPGSMFVYPVREGVELPPAFAEHALVPDDPLGLPADEIDENRDRWVDEWTEIVVR